MPNSDVTVLMAVRGQEDCARLTLSTLSHLSTPCPPVLLADNGTTPEFRAWVEGTRNTHIVQLRDRVRPGEGDTDAAAQHSRSLDDLARQVRTDWFLTLDSDVEILRPDWLTGLRAHADTSHARVVGELEPGWGPVMPRLAPHVLLLHTATFRSLQTTFEGRAEIEDPDEVERFCAVPRPTAYRLTETEAAGYRTARFFSTGAVLFARLLTEGVRWADTPKQMRRSYRHLGHMSWAEQDVDLSARHQTQQRYVRRRLALVCDQGSA